MTVPHVKKRQRRDWLDEVFDYEASHVIAFASPHALMEAHLIAQMDKARRSHPLGRSRGGRSARARPK